jgi:beta-1,2-mannobiose phosphorylase / 1,2-beta-oligomannan phosphorylase
MMPFRLQRLGIVMEADSRNAQEAGGVLNPGGARGPDGQFYLFPRLVAAGNFSRIGIARVRFNDAGDPIGVERLGIALEPEAEYELRPDGGGCEDPRITFVEELERYVMSYTAFGPAGPRIALAASDDLFQWERLGLATFRGCGGMECQVEDFTTIDNKDAVLFPTAVRGPTGENDFAIIHRPLFPGTDAHETARDTKPRAVDVSKESIWISYTPSEPANQNQRCLCDFRSHHRLAFPLANWEHLKIGGGTPPFLTKHGWVIFYHGVCECEPRQKRLNTPRLRYSAGVLVLSEKRPQYIRYRANSPVLEPELPEEMTGAVANVVFPTAVDQRADLGEPNRVDVYYGMADSRIGVARTDLPEELPVEAQKQDQPSTKL